MRIFFILLVFILSCLRSEGNVIPKSIVTTKINSPPVIDGKLEEVCWRDKEVAGDFFSLGTKDTPSIILNEPAVTKTEVIVLYDEENIYFGIICEGEDNMKIFDVNRDEYFFTGESLEIFIDPLHTHRKCFLFAINPLNIQFDAEIKEGKTDIKWNGDWASNTFIDIENKKWYAEISIPLKVFGIKKIENNEIWGINFIRNHTCYHTTSCWSNPLEVTLEKPEYLGHLIFNNPDSKFFIEKIYLNHKSYIGENNVFFKVKNKSLYEKTISVLTNIDSIEKEEIYTIGPDEEKEIKSTYFIKNLNSKNLSIVIKDNKTLESYSNFSFPIVINNPIEIFLERSIYFSGEKLIKGKVLVNISEELMKKSKIILKVQNQKEFIVKEIPDRKGEIKFELNISDLKKGNYKLVVNLCEGAKVLSSSVLSFSIEENPFF